VTPLGSPAGKDKLAAAIREIEGLSSAEVAVTVRARSGSYRDVGLGLGVLFAAATLVGFARWPERMPAQLGSWGPLLLALAGFAVGFLAAQLRGLHHALTAAARRHRQVLTCARSAFVELGVSRTVKRTGILFYASVLEGEIAAVVDTGVQPKALGPAWGTAQLELKLALVRDDAEAFAQALRGLGPVLAEALPPDHGDRNELSDLPA